MVWGLLLAAATFLAYQPAWNGQPVWDDDGHMTSPENRSLSGLAQIWTHPGGSPQYFPLLNTVFWVESQLWGDSTFGYHLLNILLHVFSALLLFRILRRLGIRGSWFAAAIFALHPVMVESVAWISELKNTLSGVFFLSASLTYLTYSETRKNRLYISALGLFLLGLLSKTTIVPFPFAMLAILWWKRGRLSWKQDIVPLLPFFLAGILLGMITLYVERIHTGTGKADFEFSLIERCLIAGRALWFYLGKVFLPVNLMICYPRWVLSTSVWWQYLFPAAALMMGCALWAVRKTWRGPAAAFFYFIAMLLPYLGFFSFYTFRYSFVADHYQYLAAIGPMVIGAILMDKAVGLARENVRVLKPAVTVILLLALGMLSWKLSGMYSNAETLYRTTIARNSSCWMAYNNLGILLSNMGRTDEAMAHYRKALKLNPNHAEAHNNLGLLMVKMGRTAEALSHYQKALEIAPNYVEAHNNIGLLLANLGRTDEALTHYQKALELAPRNTKILNNLGVLLKGNGRTEEALAQYQKALKIYPNDGDVHRNLGSLLEDMGRFDEALAHYQKALELNANPAETHYIMGLLLSKMGRIDEAIAHYRKSLEINPDQADAHNNLGILLASKGQIDEAISHFRKGLELNPSATGSLKNLAIALAQKGQWTDATSVLENAITSARSAGEEARAKAIEQITAKLNETFNSSRVNPKTRAQR